MAKQSQLFYVYDGNSYIGCYRALNGQLAIKRALEEINLGCNTFRKSQARITFKNPTAENKHRNDV